MGTGGGGTHANRLLISKNRRIKSFALSEGGSELLVSLKIVVFQPNCRREFGCSFFPLFLRRERQPKFITAFRAERVDCNGLFKLGDGLIEVTINSQDAGQLGARPRVVGLEAERFGKVAFCLVPVMKIELCQG